MLTVFRDMRKPLIVDFLKKGAVVKNTSYCQLLRQNSLYLLNDPCLYNRSSTSINKSLKVRNLLWLECIDQYEAINKPSFIFMKLQFESKQLFGSSRMRGSTCLFTVSWNNWCLSVKFHYVLIGKFRSVYLEKLTDKKKTTKTANYTYLTIFNKSSILRESIACLCVIETHHRGGNSYFSKFQGFLFRCGTRPYKWGTWCDLNSLVTVY